MATATSASAESVPPPQTTLVQRVAWNTVTNYAARLFGIGIGVVLTPFILRHIGPTSFGLWVLVGSVTSYGTLLDLGISSALIKYVAEYVAKRDHPEARRLVATAVWVYAGLGLALIVLSAVLAPLFSHFFQVPEEDRAVATWLVFAAGAGTGLWLPCSTTGAVLRGVHRFDLVNLLQVANMLLTTLGTVLVLLNGGGLLGLVVLNIVVMLVLQVPSIWFVGRAAPGIGFSPRGGSRTCVAQLVRFSGWMFAINTAGRVQTKTDEIVIGTFLPVSAVTPYSLANGLSDVALMLGDQFMKVLLPLASELHAGGDPKRLRELYMTSTRLAVGLFIAVGTTLAVLAGPILAAWVGAQYAGYGYLVIILLIADGVSASQWPAAAVLQGMARHRLLAIASIGSAVVNLALSVVLLHWIGLAGVALGTLVPTVVVSFGVVLPFTMRVLGTSLRQIGRQILVPTLVPLLPLLLVLYLLNLWVQPQTLPSLFIVAALSLIAYGLGYLCVGASSLERTSYRQLVGSMARLVKTQVGRIVSS